MKWKIIASKYLFNDLWFKVRRDTCETPQGKIVEPYYVYEFTDWVSAVPVTEDGKFILIKQYRHALGEVCIEIPGGCVDDSDTSMEIAVRRELREETGYEFSSMEFLGKISANPSTNNNIMHMFLARGGKRAGEQELDQNEEIEVGYYTVDEVKQLLRENKIIQSMHVTALMYALDKMGELQY